MPIQAIPHLALFRHESFHYSVDTGTEYITLCQLLVEISNSHLSGDLTNCYGGRGWGSGGSTIYLEGSMTVFC